MYVYTPDHFSRLFFTGSMTGWMDGAVDAMMDDHLTKIWVRVDEKKVDINSMMLARARERSRTRV